MASPRSINSDGFFGRILLVVSRPANVLLLVAVVLAVLSLIPEAQPAAEADAVGAVVVPAPDGDDGARALAGT